MYFHNSNCPLDITKNQEKILTLWLYGNDFQYSLCQQLCQKNKLTKPTTGVHKTKKFSFSAVKEPRTEKTLNKNFKTSWTKICVVLILVFLWRFGNSCEWLRKFRYLFYVPFVRLIFEEKINFEKKLKIYCS